MSDDSTDPLITTRAELDELITHLRSAGRFAFDTEFVSEETYEPVLCLAQVATRDRLSAIDPLARGLDLEPLWELVNDPDVEVVMHAAGEDLRICRIKTGRLPARVFDTQIAAGLAGFSYPLSLVNLVGQTVGVPLAGSETRTDWRRRPLSDAQVRYALDDVRHLLEVADFLTDRLKQWGRSAWIEAEFAGFIEQVRQRAEDDRWRRLPGLNNLNRRSLEVARRLSRWRQEEARDANRPLRQVMRDDLLVAIAKRQPRSRKDLEALRDFNRPALLGRTREILDVIAEALAVPEDQLPRLPDRPDDGPGLQMTVSLLSATLARCCAEHRAAVGLVGTVSDLKDVIRWHLEGRPQNDRPPSLIEGWRGEVCGRSLLDVLSGRLALRLTDPAADVPVTLEPLHGDG
ncbi:HRDC domain-containing protein [soil metagenome]